MPEEITQKSEEKKGWASLVYKDKLTASISLSSLAISIAGFSCVVLTLMSNGRTISTNTYLQTYGWTLEVDKMLVEHPTLWPYFYDSLARMPSCADDSLKVQAMAEYMLDNFDAVLNNKSYYEIDPKTGKDWKETVRYYFQHSPVLRDRFRKERKLFGDTLASVYDKALIPR